MIKRFITLLIMGAVLAVSCEDPAGVVTPEPDPDPIPGIENLEQIEELQKLAREIQETLVSYQEIQDELLGYIEDLQGKVEGLSAQDSQLESSLSALGRKYDELDNNIKGIGDLVEKNGSDVKKWAADNLVAKDAFTKASNSISDLNTSIKTINTRLDALDDSAKKVAKDIEEATKEINGKIAGLQKSISGIVTELSKLDVRIDKLEKELEALIAAVQSIVVVPDYSDGSVKVSDIVNNKFYFDIYPHSAAEKIAALGTESVSFDAVETISKSSEKTKISIKVTEVGYEEGFFYVIADGTALSDDIKNGIKTANASLRVSDGKLTRSSDYFQLTYKVGQSNSSISISVDDVYEFHPELSGTTTILKEKDTDEVLYGILLSDDMNKELSFGHGRINWSDTLNLVINEAGILSNPNKGNKCESNRKYRYRPYAYKNGEFFYGDEGTFTTLSGLKNVSIKDSTVNYGITMQHISADLDMKSAGYTVTNAEILLSEQPDGKGTTKRMTVSVNSEGNISTEIYGLDENKKYYYTIRYLVYNPTTYGYAYLYSDEIEITTGIVPDFIDLGLSVKWGTSELISPEPDEYGNNYFCWANINDKDKWAVYNEETNTLNFTKYNSTDNLTRIQAEDDPATVLLGSDCHTPTKAEWEELFDPANTTVRFISGNFFGKYLMGRIFRSRKEGFTDKALFFPNGGFYWTSDIYFDSDFDVYDYNSANYAVPASLMVYKANRSLIYDGVLVNNATEIIPVKK